MATVKLEFELDSEVYPELHAALASMRSARARAERMRQLAAAGLVWEKVRLHGAAAVAPPTAADFVDLAIDAGPAPAAPAEPPRRGVQPSRNDVERAIRELPVLVDVVESGNAPVFAGEAEPPADADDAADAAVAEPEAALHVTALSQRPATRSRLMRMKDRGLFRNG